MSRYRLVALFLALAIMTGLVALLIGWSASATFLEWIAQGFGIGVLGVVAFWLLLVAAAVLVPTVFRLFSARGSDRS